MKIAVSFEHFYFTWHGGLNYFRNLFAALRRSGGVEIVLFGGCAQKENLQKHFPGESIVVSSLLDRRSPQWLVRSIVRKVVHRDLLLERLLQRHAVDVLTHSVPLGRGSSIPCAAWIPDFQHLHLPELCSEEELQQRDKGMRFLCKESDLVFVSSQAAADDLVRFSPESAGKVSVLRFSIPPLVQKQILSKDEVARKYGLESVFVYNPNQFWAHKNHMALIKAATLLKQSGQLVPMIVFSGAMEDYRKAGYSNDVRRAVEEAGLESRVRFLGVVPYSDVMSLMTHCTALVNPSLFEGWSTTVEEAKSLGKNMFLSSLNVHMEQAAGLARFFDPRKPEELASLLAGTGSLQRSEPPMVDEVEREFKAFGDRCRVALHGIMAQRNAARAAA